MLQEAPTIPCSRCGSALPVVDPSAPAATCAHCGASTAVPQEIRDRARAYVQAVAAERGRASFSQKLGQRMAAGDAFGRKLMVAILALTALLTAGQMAPAFLDVPRGTATWAFFAFFAGLAIVLAWFFWSIATGADEKAEQKAGAQAPPVALEPEGAVKSACSSCGAPVSFVVGEASARCAYCSATVVATAADQAALLALAGKRADLEQARAERVIYRGQAGFQRAMHRTFSWLRLGLRVGMPSVMFVFMGSIFLSNAGTVPHHRGRHAPPPVEPVFFWLGLGMIGLGVAILVIAVLIGLLIHYLSRPRVIRRALDVLAMRTRGRVATGGVLPALDWLDAHWAASAPAEVMTMAASDSGDPGERWTLETAYGGRPALVTVAHAPHVRRIDVFLAAYARRGDEARQVETSGPGQEAMRLGFRPEVSTAGVHLAHADSDPAALGVGTIERVLGCAAVMVGTGAGR